MSIETGTRLGRYEIRSQLGAGGMGEVYRARDLELGRDVAIKVLPSTFSTDRDRLHRFQQEACAAGALNHPNVLVVHDIGSHAGAPYVVSELLEGETLRKRIGGTPLGQRRAIDYALQIANGLAAAHEKGIIHRDLKPDNIFITNDGRAKILDFGLAKLTQLDGDQAQTDIPTRRVDTDPGVVMGTVGYMSPEQLKGRAVDQRSDIFSFGAILYEMLSGRRAFHGDSAAETMSAILKEDPSELSDTNKTVSPALERIVNHCLEKNAELRFHSARDLAFALESLSGSTATETSTVPAVGPRRMKKRELIAWIVAATAVLTAVALAIVRFQRVPAEVRTVRSFILPPEKSSFDFSARVGSNIAVSPDGRRLAFVAAVEGKQLLWIRSLESVSVQALAGTEGAIYPFWSADSRFVGFFAEQRLKKIDVAGGPPITLCNAPDGRGGTWNRDGVIVFAPSSSGVLYRIAAAGGVATAVTKLDEARVETSHRWPFFLPDGEHFLYLSGGGAGFTISEGAAIAVSSLTKQDSKVITSANSNAAYAQGYLLFLRERTLMAQGFDPKRLETTGDAFPIGEQVQTGRAPGTGIFSVSEDGVLVYQSGPGESGSELIWFDRTNKPVGKLGDLSPYNSFSLSPDGKSATVAVSNQVGGSNLWLYEVARGLKTPFTFGAAQTRGQVWSPDGGTIFFTSNRKGHFDLYRKASSGAGSEELLVESNLDKTATSISPDGRFLLYHAVDPKTKADLWVLPLDGGQKPFAFLQGEFNEVNAQFSPDGRWVAYQSDESGRSEIYVTPFPSPSGKRQISTSGGRWPKWRGKEVFYLTLDNKLMVSEVNVNGETVEIGSARSLFEIRPGGPGNIYDVSADGQRFLVNMAVEQQITAPLTLVLNWTADLKK
jgi:serine/threonine protein kinase/Tol biopolymer transport system component